MEWVRQPRTDVRAAASFVPSDSVPRLRDRELRERFMSLPAAAVQNHSSLGNLCDAAEAVLWTQSALTQVDGGASQRGDAPARRDAQDI